MLAIARWQASVPDAGIRMIMQVHDELVFEVPKDLVDLAKNNIKLLMEETTKLSVPLQVSIGIGANWDEAH